MTAWTVLPEAPLLAYLASSAKSPNLKRVTLGPLDDGSNGDRDLVKAICNERKIELSFFLCFAG